MTQADDTLLRRRGLAFFGAIAASLSHELSNVFATINELSGLLEDLAAAAERGKTMDPQKVNRVAGRIGAQLHRGQLQTKQLNRFAHSADSALAAVDGGQVVGEMVTLCERFARLKKVELVGAVSDEPVPMETDPFLLRQLVWLCVDSALAVSEPGARAEIALTATDEGVRLEASASGSGSKATGAGDDELAAIVQALGGSILEQPDAGEPFRLAVALPQREATTG